MPQNRDNSNQTPLLNSVQDVVMIDRTRAEMFSALGKTRSIFQGIDRWPTLDEVFKTYSRCYREQYGHTAWEAAGGEYGDDDQPTCRRDSAITVEAMRWIVDSGCGLRLEDRDGLVWAVRLVQASNGDPNSFFGFSISWQGDRTRQLRLYRPAEQILWAIHQAVMSQRCSTIMLPDIWLGQIIWGGDRKSWPDDWRGQIMSVLKSLMLLRSEVLRFTPAECRPRVGAASVAVAHAELLAITRPQEDVCRECCPLWGTKHRHSHFLVQVGHGFLGVLENFMSGSLAHGKTYDFVTIPKDEQGKTIRQSRKSGQIITVNAPVAMMGQAKWSPLKGVLSPIVQALIREITRVPRGRSGVDDGNQFLDRRSQPHAQLDERSPFGWSDFNPFGQLAP